MFAKLYLSITLACLLNGCQARQADSSQGLAELVSRIYSGTVTDSTKPMMMFSVKIWYKDSMAIEENAILQSFTDSKNRRSRQVKILNYRFNDLRNRVIYVYGSFSDTARLISKYLFEDTTVKNTGGWGFNQSRRVNYVGNPQPLSDTIIRGIKYERLKSLAEANNVTYKVTLYFRCDRPNSIFSFESHFSKNKGCPCVKFINQMPDDRNGALIEEIDFLRDTLSIQELKVFDAWEQNAKANPARK
jgi:hypothetical protein